MEIKIKTAADPVRYYCRLVDGASGRQAFGILLQVNDDNETCIVTSFKESTRAKSPCITHYEGTIEDFCRRYKAIPNGLKLPEVVLRKFIEESIVKIMIY